MEDCHATPLTPEQIEARLAEITPRQREYWATWNHENNVKGRRERLAQNGGKDNHGGERQKYLDTIRAMDMDHLKSETYQMLYHSARCSNNHRADWHWMVDVCYDELMSRTCTDEAYSDCLNEVRRDHCG